MSDFPLKIEQLWIFKENYTKHLKLVNICIMIYGTPYSIVSSGEMLDERAF